MVYMYGMMCRLCMHKLQVLVKSFLATQDLCKLPSLVHLQLMINGVESDQRVCVCIIARCSLIVHTDDVDGLRGSAELRALLPYFQVVPFDMHAIAKDTEFEGQWVLDVVDSKAYLTGIELTHHYILLVGM